MVNNPLNQVNADFGGGGFLPPPSQATQTAQYGVPPANNRDAQGSLPLTLKQISDGFVIGDVYNVKLVGKVFDKKEITFVLDDETGRIDCYRLINEYIHLQEMVEIKNGMLVEIHGHLKGLPCKHLEAFSVRPVADIDQVAHRFMQCMNVQCNNTKSQGKESHSDQLPITNAAIVNRPSSYQTNPSDQFYGQPTFAGIRQKILDFLSVPSLMEQEKGTDMAEVAQRLKVPRLKIMEAIKDLEEEGLVYSTIDDFHYKLIYETAPSNQFYGIPTYDGNGQKVLEFLSMPLQMARENGVHQDEIAHHLNVSTETIMGAIRSLKEARLVRSTIDYYHYKCVIVIGTSSYETVPSNQSYGLPTFAENGIALKILYVLASPPMMAREMGVHLDEIAHHLNVPRKKIMETLRSLYEHDLVYTTIDDCHIKSSIHG